MPYKLPSHEGFESQRAVRGFCFQSAQFIIGIVGEIAEIVGLGEDVAVG